MNPHERHLNDCPNCDQPIKENFCPACGQPATDYRASLGRLIKDFFSDYLHLESRLFRTVIPLLIKPGFLTREYMDGRRQRYIRPIRLYLVATIVSLVLISMKLAGVLSTSATYQRQADHVIATADTSALMSNDIYTSLADSMGWQAFRPTIARRVEGARARVRQARRDSTLSIDSLATGPRPFSYYLNSFGAQMNDEEFRAAVFTRFVSNIPKVMFFFLPVFALLLKVFYIRRKRFYVEHLIFALHFHAFLFLITAAAVTTPLHPGFAVLIGLIYFIAGLRRIYQQGWVKTIIKGLIIFFIYQILIGTAFGFSLVVQGIMEAAATEGVPWRQLIG